MKQQESYWTYKAPPIPEVWDLPAGTFAGTEDDWSKLTPGYRREIYRQAMKAPRKPTIYEALKEKLGREPSHSEQVAEVKRILVEGAAERAAGGAA